MPVTPARDARSHPVRRNMPREGVERELELAIGERSRHVLLEALLRGLDWSAIDRRSRRRSRRACAPSPAATSIAVAIEPIAGDRPDGIAHLVSSSSSSVVTCAALFGRACARRVGERTFGVVPARAGRERFGSPVGDEVAVVIVELAVAPTKAAKPRRTCRELGIVAEILDRLAGLVALAHGLLFSSRITRSRRNLIILLAPSSWESGAPSFGHPRRSPMEKKGRSPGERSGLISCRSAAFS
jgi:hypothetical protein